MSDETEVRKHLWEKLAKSPFLMVELIGAHAHAEPMTAQLDKDADGKFWFYTRNTNRIAAGGPAMAQFASKGHTLFACMRGNLVPKTDPAVIDRYWSNQTEAWFEGGRNDPSLLMLRFELEDAEIWESDESIAGMFKMLTGQKIRTDETGRHAEVTL